MRQGRLSTRRGSIAILFPSFLGGGAEAVCLWMLEALRQDHELTLHTFSEIDFRTLNRDYGTSLADGQVRIERPYAGAAFNRFLAGSPRLFTLRQHLLIRHFKRLTQPYDLCISAFNEMDLGTRGIQYIHFPLIGRGHETVRSEVLAPDSKARAAYRDLCRLLSGFSELRMKQNLTIANSRWTAGIVKRVYDIEARVIYPPVSGDFPKVAWEQKRIGFIVVGRIVPEKRVEIAFDIVKRLRREGHDVQLCIAGRSGAPAYLAYLRRLLKGNESWASIRTDLTREGLSELSASYRYGLHVRENEQFGIGVAEMLKAGCIPFVSARGGQTEIVGSQELLLFHRPEQAVERIAKVLSSKRIQNQLRQGLKYRSKMFSAERFMAEIRKAVKEFLAA
jgi:glycosyltransferase involved in cell wall biosynthesis